MPFQIDKQQAKQLNQNENEQDVCQYLGEVRAPQQRLDQMNQLNHHRYEECRTQTEYDQVLYELQRRAHRVTTIAQTWQVRMMLLIRHLEFDRNINFAA
jgi:hypothetical protein